MTVHLHIGQVSVEGISLDAGAVPDLEQALRLRLATSLSGLSASSAELRSLRRDSLQLATITFSSPLAGAELGSTVAEVVSTGLTEMTSSTATGERR